LTHFGKVFFENIKENEAFANDSFSMMFTNFHDVYKSNSGFPKIIQF